MSAEVAAAGYAAVIVLAWVALVRFADLPAGGALWFALWWPFAIPVAVGWALCKYLDRALEPLTAAIRSFRRRDKWLDTDGDFDIKASSPYRIRPIEPQRPFPDPPPLRNPPLTEDCGCPIEPPTLRTIEIQPEGETVAIEFNRPIGERDPDDCGNCHRCVSPWEGLQQRMIVCATCGNKRCPRAADHRNGCTGSNAAGQVGSHGHPFAPTPGMPQLCIECDGLESWHSNDPEGSC